MSGSPVAVPTHRVLIVDDEIDIAEILVDIVEGEGFAATVAANGRVALEALAAGPYNLVLSDLIMPEMDGIALYRALCADHPALAEGIVFITGDTLSEPVQRFLREIRRPTIEKPFMPDDVRAVLRAALAPPD